MDDAERLAALRALERLVRGMRQCQRDWFKHSRPADLTSAKDYEKKVDRALADLADSPQPSLF